MDPKTLAERVAKLAESSQALAREHVAKAEAKEEPAPEAEAAPKDSPEVIFTDGGRVRSIGIAKRAEPEPVAKGGLPDTVARVNASNTLPSLDELNTMFSNAGAVMPPYDPMLLVMLFEHSNALRPNVDAYVTNIESFGSHFEPMIDLDAADVNDTIGDAMFLDRLQAVGDAPLGQAAYPTPDEIENKKVEIKHAMRLEKARLDMFIEGAVPETSMTTLREWSRVDEEVTGNAYWEVLRNARGDVAQFTYVPAQSIRLMPLDWVATEVRAPLRVSAISAEHTTTLRKFRKYVQIVYNRIVYFKEFGDPRAMDSNTGEHFPTFEALKAARPKAIAATEIVHFKIHSPRTPYGVPRWIGNLLAVLGSRSSEEVNYLYFDNKAIPPVAILVSGGRLADGSDKKIESFLKNHIQGRENFHKVLILEAVGPGTPQLPGMPDQGRVRIEIEKLTDAQLQDALFQNYDANNIDKIGSSFRVPRLIRGDVRDFNKATAESALEFSEMQVFQPERNRFDQFMNRQILPAMGVRFWKYVTNTPISKDPETLTDIIVKLVTANVLTPGEGREQAKDVFNRELKKIDDEWTKIPTALLLAGVTPDGDLPAPGASAAAAPAAAGGAKPAAAPATDKNLAAAAANLSALRDKLQGAAKGAAERVAKEARRAAAEEVIEIRLTKEEMAELVVPA